MIPHYLEIKLDDDEFLKFRQVVKARMKERKWTNKDLAENMGVKQFSLEHFLYDYRRSRFMAAQLANFLQIKPEEFVIEKPRQKKGSFFGGWHIGIVLAIFAVPLTLSVMPAEKVEAKEIDFSKYIVETERDIETEVFGVDNGTDFEPGYYEFEPYPDAIVKHIEATAYCYGTTTYSGKAVREGMAAMSKRYLGMTAIVYESDENGNPLDYIGTYEIEDTGGDERIKNGNCIDIFMSSREECINFGRRNVVVYLIEAKG